MTRALIAVALCLALSGCSWGLFCYPKSCLEWLVPPTDKPAEPAEDRQ